jgi:hypothetical protein
MRHELSEAYLVAPEGPSLRRLLKASLLPHPNVLVYRVGKGCAERMRQDCASVSDRLMRG